MTERRQAVFLGSGAFAVPALEAVASSTACELVAVVTAPARPAGRGGHAAQTPVHVRGASLGLPLLTPDRLRAPTAVAALTDLAPDLIVLADYGQLVPPALLNLPACGALNLHPSLLPRHRGASPIPAAILAGDTETGVSLMRMDEGFDTGPLVAQTRLSLDGAETTPALEGRLAVLAAELLARSLEPWLAGRLAAVPQAEVGATMTRPLRRADGRLDPARPAHELERKVRAYQPWPGTWFETTDGRIVVWAADVVSVPPDAPPGDGGVGWLRGDGDGLALVTPDGRLRLLEVQPAGGRRMSAAELRRGRPGLVDCRLLEPSLG